MHRECCLSRSLSPSGDLLVLLEVLTSHPFEPVEHTDIKVLSLKGALLLLLATAKRMSDIHSLSVHPARMCFAPWNCGLTLRPNLAFSPTVGPYTPADLAAFQPPPPQPCSGAMTVHPCARYCVCTWERKGLSGKRTRSLLRGKTHH